MTWVALCLPFSVGCFGVGSGSSEGHRGPDAGESEPRGLPAQWHPPAQTAAGSTGHREAPESCSLQFRAPQLTSRRASKGKAALSKKKNITAGVWKCSVRTGPQRIKLTGGKHSKSHNFHFLFLSYFFRSGSSLKTLDSSTTAMFTTWFMIMCMHPDCEWLQRKSRNSSFHSNISLFFKSHPFYGTEKAAKNSLINNINIKNTIWALMPTLSPSQLIKEQLQNRRAPFPRIHWHS